MFDEDEDEMDEMSAEERRLTRTNMSRRKGVLYQMMTRRRKRREEERRTSDRTSQT